MDPIYYVIIPIAALAALVLLGFSLWLYLICPGRRRGVMDKYKNVRYAHRGLHGEGRAENSLSAFRAAKETGYGIELDVRLSSDGELMVFHDSTLVRMTGACGLVAEKTAAELSELHLGETSDVIPTFRQVLALIDGAVPLLIEVKQEKGEASPVARLVELLDGYHGDYIVESFNPIALKELKAKRPDIPRGFLAMKFTETEKHKGSFLYAALQGLYMNFLMRPDFISYEKSGYTEPNLRYIRKTFGTPLLAWTVKSEEEEREAFGHGFDTVIFEGYLSEK